jgi:basic membrane lipoprotein Med (substrate-binding protein (PBP1-ABC) superfamily)
MAERRLIVSKLRKFLFPIVTLLAMSLVAAACGSDDGGTAAPAATTAAPVATTAAPVATTAAPVATTAAPVATTAAPEPAEVKAAFIYVGPVGDGGWTWAHDQGRQFAAEQTGVETAFVEMVPEGTADFGIFVRDFIGQGYNVIFGTSFGYMDDMLALADEYPNVVFEHISGYKANDTNFGNTFGRMYEPRYLSGMVAGSMASSKIKYGCVDFGGDLLPDTISRADWAAPGVALRYTAGKMHGGRGVQDGWCGKIVGSGWPVGKTVYLIPCAGSYDTFDYSKCRYDDASPGELVVDDDGNIATYFWNVVEQLSFWGPLGRAEGDCTLASTYGPDGRASTGDEIEAVICDDPAPPPLIGYVAAFPIPEVIRGINAFTLGVREVNPNAVVEVNWTSTWFDPVVEGDAAQALLDKGADVIAMHQDSTAAGQAAEAAGARWVSYNSDMSAFAPEAYLTAPVWNWGPRYVEIIEAVRAGTYTPGYYWGSMADGVVDLAPIAADVDSRVTDRVMAAKEAIIAGDLHPFTGPIHDQAGNLILADGVVMDDGAMLSMSFFVDGVIGTD